MSSGKASICKYLFSVSSSAQCQEITTMTSLAYCQLKMNDYQLFIIGNESPSTYHLHMYKVTFGNINVDWANKIQWIDGVWSPSKSEAILSSDMSLIYSFIPFGYSKYLYFTTFNSTNGNVIGSRYKSSTNIIEVYGITQVGVYICASVFNSPVSHIVMYNTETSQFSIRKASSWQAYTVRNDPTTGR